MSASRWKDSARTQLGSVKPVHTVPSQHVPLIVSARNIVWLDLIRWAEERRYALVMWVRPVDFMGNCPTLWQNKHYRQAHVDGEISTGDVVAPLQGQLRDLFGTPDQYSDCPDEDDLDPDPE